MLDWPSLWKLEPSLRPDNMAFCGDPSDPEHFCIQVGHHDDISIANAAELCAMKAVRWLLARDIVVVQSNLPTEPENWSIYKWPSHTPEYVGDADSCDMALFVACQTILNSRKPTPAV